ncbi:MAG TPA: MarR family transcriptional regulator [Firmicutes bacterium]|jgi:DNA-binding MarR family transcriptional regulator|nr:MarR family transcriptional regulator [Bacillota bacterium]
MDTHKEIFLMQQTYATLFSLANKIQMKGDQYFQSLTSRQFMAMIAILHLPEDETTLNNIAKKLGTSKQSVKQLITIIENKGYVTLVSSRKDKRAVNINITESGKQVMLECSAKGLNFFGDLFKDFTTKEMELLWELLKKMYRFDGEPQDDFEAEAALDISAEQNEAQIRALKEFERRRMREKSESKSLKRSKRHE